MKTIGFIALFLILTIQLLFFGFQTYLATAFQKNINLSELSYEKDRNQIRKPSSVEDETKKGPIQQIKYQILPNNTH